MERKKMMTSIFPLAIVWYGFGDEEARRTRERTLGWLEPFSSTRTRARKSKVNKGSLYIGRGVGSHHLTNLMGL